MKFNVKHLMAVSTVILAMIGAGGAINANNSAVHADDTSAADALLNDPSTIKDSEEDEKSGTESEHEENEVAEPQRKQQAKEEMQDGFLDRDFYKDPAVHHYLRKLGYSNHQMKKGIAVENNDNNNNDVHYGSKAENRLARKARKYSNRYHKHSKKSVRKHARHYKKATKRNRKIRKRVSKRSPKLSYYAQGRKLGKYIHHNKDDNYGGVKYLLNNKKVFNKKFDNGYFKGYTTADPGDDENPAPRARVAFKVAKTYQSSHSKTFKQGVRDSFKNYFYGRFNKHYSHNKSYKYGYHYFRSLSAKSNQNW